MNPFILLAVGVAVVVICAILAILLVRGARSARIANEIYDGYGPKNELKLARDDHGHPTFAKWAASDQEGCRACGQTWDRNELYPPRCEPINVGAFNVTQCVNCGKRWRTGGAIPRHCEGEKS